MQTLPISWALSVQRFFLLGGCHRRRDLEAGGMAPAAQTRGRGSERSRDVSKPHSQAAALPSKPGHQLPNLCPFRAAAPSPLRKAGRVLPRQRSLRPAFLSRHFGCAENSLERKQLGQHCPAFLVPQGHLTRLPHTGRLEKTELRSVPSGGQVVESRCPRAALPTEALGEGPS